MNNVELNCIMIKTLIVKFYKLIYINIYINYYKVTVLQLI